MELFNGTRGSREPEILIVGEAWGREEATARLPFVGASGKELDRMLFEAGLPLTKLLFTNLVSSHPPGNEFTHFLNPNGTMKKQPRFRGIFPKPELLQGLTRLEKLINQVKPKLIIGLGNWPFWALTDRATISTSAGFSLPGGVMSWRGSELLTREINGTCYPFLPTIHPAAVLRSWDLRHLVVHDLKTRGANYLAGKKSWGEPNFHHNPNPTLAEVRSSLGEWTSRLAAGPVELSVDIETSQRKFITCLGIADADTALCIPFFWWSPDGLATQRWEPAEEAEIWLSLKGILEHDNCKIIGQNFAYDSVFLARMAGIHCRVHFDTMLAHHLCWPGTPKGLDMLASLYLDNYVYWKDESQEWSTETDHLSNWTYNCKDTRYTYDIAQTLKKVVSHFQLDEQYKCQLEQWEMSRDMGLRGVRIDGEAKATVQRELSSALRCYEEFLLECMPEDLRHTASGGAWFNSPKMSQEIFYHYLGIQPVLHKKTKRPTLDATSFETIKKRAPWTASMVDALDRMRSIGVFMSHFLAPPISPDGCIRTSFNVGGTDTFRWSSNSNPFGEGTNLQNIPKGDK